MDKQTNGQTNKGTNKQISFTHFTSSGLHGQGGRGGLPALWPYLLLPGVERESGNKQVFVSLDCESESGNKQVFVSLVIVRSFNFFTRSAQ